MKKKTTKQNKQKNNKDRSYSVGQVKDRVENIWNDSLKILFCKLDLVEIWLNNCVELTEKGLESNNIYAFSISNFLSLDAY